MENKEERIHRKSIGYNLLRAYAMFALRNFYKKIEVAGKENIPYGSKVIITPNHQNALMDAMLVNYAIRKTRIVFMARADIFRNKTQLKILTYLKMLPIYRMRDGAQELAKNEELFERAVKIVADNVPLCLMPEGSHGDKRRLRNFVKGAFRLAFRVKTEVGEKDDVYILPVGLDFQDYQKFNQNLLVVIGKPVSLNEFISEYNENQPRALNSLRDRISDEMKKLMIHIGNEELYQMYQDMRHIWNSRMKQLCGIRGRTHFHAFRADKMMIRILDQAWEAEPDKLRKLAEVTSSYMGNLKKLNMRNWVVARKGLRTGESIFMLLRLIITSPIALYGFINNILPFHLAVRKTRKVKDPQFLSSFRYVLAMLLFPVFYILQTLAVGIISDSGLIALFYLLSLPVTGYYALYYTFWYKKLRASIRFKRLFTKKDKLVSDTLDNYIEIMKTMEGICSVYLHKMPVENKERYE